MFASQFAWMGGLDHGEAGAVRALGFVSNDQRELKRFLARTGLSPANFAKENAALRGGVFTGRRTREGQTRMSRSFQGLRRRGAP